MMVFLSHSPKDYASFVRPLAEALESNGITTWCGERDIQQGEDWIEATNKALALSDCVLCVLSDDVIASPSQIASELDTALRYGKRLLAISLTQHPLPPEIAFRLTAPVIMWHERPADASLSLLLRELNPVAGATSCCPFCGSQVLSGARFCSTCGHTLVTAQPRPASSPSYGMPSSEAPLYSSSTQTVSSHPVAPPPPPPARTSAYAASPRTQAAPSADQVMSHQEYGASSPAPSSGYAMPQSVPQADAAAPPRKRKGAFGRLRDFVTGRKDRSHQPDENLPQQPPTILPPPLDPMTFPTPYVQPQPPLQTEFPTPRLSDVSFSAIAPRGLVPGRYTIIDIVMFEEGWEAVVHDVAAEHEESVRTITSSWTKVREGAHVRVELTCHELGLLDSQEQVWSGRYLRYSYPVMVPEGQHPSQALFVASVSFDGVPATRLSFVAEVNDARRQEMGLTRNDIHTAFVSYASADRAHVATIVQGMQAVRPDLDLFFDVESLRTGDDWEHVLKTEISKRDMLFLCWSQNARASKWVDFEWRYALKQHGISSIEPVAIDPPEICPPPAELSSKHFNDRLLYVINYQTRAENYGIG